MPARQKDTSRGMKTPGTEWPSTTARIVRPRASTMFTSSETSTPNGGAPTSAHGPARAESRRPPGAARPSRRSPRPRSRRPFPVMPHDRLDGILLARASIVSVAPSSRASSRRAGERSIAMIGDAADDPRRHHGREADAADAEHGEARARRRASALSTVPVPVWIAAAERRRELERDVARAARPRCAPRPPPRSRSSTARRSASGRRSPCDEIAVLPSARQARKLCAKNAWQW